MKILLIFHEIKLFNLKHKSSCLFKITLRVFHHCFDGCFHFFMFSFILVFSSVFTVDRICSLLCFFTVCQYFVFVLFYRYGFEKALFTLKHFLSYTPSCFYQTFSGAAGSFLKVSGLPTEVQNTESAHLFV